MRNVITALEFTIAAALLIGLAAYFADGAGLLVQLLV